MDTDELVAPIVIPLVDGNRLTMWPGTLVISDRAGAVITRLETRDITSVHRGGTDIIVTRREADPVVLIAASVADAQRVIVALREQQPARPPRSRWRLPWMQR